VFHPDEEMAALKERLSAVDAQAMQSLRSSANERIFFRQPVNGYVFEVIAQSGHIHTFNLLSARYRVLLACLPHLRRDDEYHRCGVGPREGDSSSAWIRTQPRG